MHVSEGDTRQSILFQTHEMTVTKDEGMIESKCVSVKKIILLGQSEMSFCIT